MLGPAYAAGVKIGYVGGISGACGGLTHSARKAMEIAQDEINSAGGVLGGPIEIVWRDSKTKPDEGSKQARDLILSEKVDLLTGVCLELGVHGHQPDRQAVRRAAVQRDQRGPTRPPSTSAIPSWSRPSPTP